MKNRSRTPRFISKPVRYFVVGYHDHDFGLAVAARNSVDALRASGRHVDLVRVDPWRAPENPRPVNDGVPGVNLFQVNPNEVGSLAHQWFRAVGASAPNVSVPFWELPLLPRSWEPVLSRMDAILAPTRFIGDACRVALPGVPILDYPQAAYLPAGVKPDRAAWGLPEGATVFVVAFGLGSDIDRKNPWTAIAAFQEAFPKERDVRLVVKTRPWPGLAEADRWVRELAEHVSGDVRIKVVDRALGFEQQLQLYASCDVLASTHRSEGLGLHLMESMSMGRVVAATGWSGNVDFMRPENSVPLAYRLVPVETRHEAYAAELGRTGQVWAETDLADTVRAMRMLHESPEMRFRLGAAAARDMEERRRTMRSGAAFAGLEEAVRGRQGRRLGMRGAAARTWIRAQAGRMARVLSRPKPGCE